MHVGIIVFAAFAVLTVLAGGLPRRRVRDPRRAPDPAPEKPGRSAGWIESASSYFLDNRTLGAFALFLTIAATNFSAFTVLGLSGAGYRMGYVFYPVMAAGTGFMALGMYLVGLPMVRNGRRLGWITPVDCVADRFGSPVLSRLYALSLVVFTVPYLALQPMAAGMLLESAMGLPYRVGVISVAFIICLYTVSGGMRAVVRTDVFHGILFFGLALAAWLILVVSLGGFVQAHDRAFALGPWLFSRPGGPVSSTGTSAGLPFGAWAGYFLLWFLADPVFPQLGQRFLAARDDRALERTVAAYPIVTMTLFFFTVSFGVLATVIVPGLSAQAADRIWPIAVARLNGPLVSAILLLAPIAALMTTMDSQLLTLSSIVVRDLAGYRGVSRIAPRLAVVFLTLTGTVLALYPPGNILVFLNKTAFAGYAALAPLVFGTFYGRKAGARTALASLVAGECVALCLGAGFLVLPGIPEIFPVAISGWSVFIAGSFIEGRRKTAPDGISGAAIRFSASRLSEMVSPGWAVAFLCALAPLMDFWNWDRAPLIILGLPDWVWRTALSCCALSILFMLYFRKRRRTGGSDFPR